MSFLRVMGVGASRSKESSSKRRVQENATRQPHHDRRFLFAMSIVISLTTLSSLFINESGSAFSLKCPEGLAVAVDCGVGVTCVQILIPDCGSWIGAHGQRIAGCWAASTGEPNGRACSFQLFQNQFPGGDYYGGIQGLGSGVFEGAKATLTYYYYSNVCNSFRICSDEVRLGVQQVDINVYGFGETPSTVRVVVNDNKRDSSCSVRGVVTALCYWSTESLR